MSRYIDREAVRRAIQEYCYSPKGITPDGIAKIIMSAPTVDVVEVRHGEWLLTPMKNKECSLCHSIYHNTYQYCPNCGAKMDGERKENER